MKNFPGWSREGPGPVMLREDSALSGCGVQCAHSLSPLTPSDTFLDAVRMDSLLC